MQAKQRCPERRSEGPRRIHQDGGHPYRYLPPLLLHIRRLQLYLLHPVPTGVWAGQEDRYTGDLYDTADDVCDTLELCPEHGGLFL